MAKQVHHLFDRARTALQVTQVGLAEALGASRRTGQRWDANKSYPAESQLVELAKRVHPVDPTLAADIAASLETTLDALGLGPPAASLATPVAIDSVVCAAAEAMDASPRAVRSGLLAAFSRARELQLTLEAVEKALQGKPAAKGVKAPKS